MLVVIAFNEVPPDAAEDERDVLVQVASVSKAIEQLGHRFVTLPVTLDLAAMNESLETHHPDVVFNLVESLDGADRLAPYAAAAIEKLGLPLTGSPSNSIWLSNHKTLAKQLLRSVNLPTPDWFDPFGASQESAPGMNRSSGTVLGHKFIIKPQSQHASFGMDASSIVEAHDADELLRLVRQRSDHLGQPCFAEQFIEGQEFNVSLLADDAGCCVLPVAEIDFSAFPDDKPRIVDYNAKWLASSFEYQHTPHRFLDASEEPPLYAKLTDLARQCWRVFQLRGYARVDFRVSADHHPWILEINTNPCLSPDAGFAAALCQAGIEYSEAIKRIIADALRDRTGTHRNALPEMSIHAAKSTRPPPTNASWRYEAVPADAAKVHELVTATEFFFPDEVDVAEELVRERLAKGDESGYFFVFAESGNEMLGYACFGPIACTRASYDLYWIAVHPKSQGGGIGKQILRKAEEEIRRRGGQRVYIETSNRPQYQSTRGFYERCSYVRDATLTDFYGPGDDKVIYVKQLAGR